MQKIQEGAAYVYTQMQVSQSIKKVDYKQGLVQIPLDAVEVVSSAAWLSGAMPCSFMAKISKS